VSRFQSGATVGLLERINPCLGKDIAMVAL